MHCIKFFLFLAFLGISITSFSQTQEKFDVNRDIDIVKVFLRVVKDGHGTPQVYKELANAYYFRNNFAESKKWFEKLFYEKETIDSTHLYRYKQTLKALGFNSENIENLRGVGTN